MVDSNVTVDIVKTDNSRQRIFEGVVSNYQNVEATATPIPGPAPAEPKQLAITKATASGFEAGTTNTPDKVHDGKLETRWAIKGLNNWIQLDHELADLHFIKVAQFKGDLRTLQFECYVQDEQGKFVMAGVFTTTKSLTPASENLKPQTFKFQNVIKGKAIKLVNKAVSDGSGWFSLTEVEVWGVPATASPPPEPTPEPEPEPVPEPTPEPQPTPIPTDDFDKFGVRKLLPTKPGGQEWYFDASDGKDPQFDPQNTIAKNADGSWKMKSTKVRMNVFTSAGYHPERISTTDQKALAAKGYMQDPASGQTAEQNNWKNVEQTGAVKINAGSGDNFAWYGRGGKHSDVPCEGTSYKNDLYDNGDNGWKKEQWHSGGYSSFVNKKNAAKYSAKGKWVWFKVQEYNEKDATGKEIVRLILLASLDGKTFEKINERVDSGGWGSAGTKCGGTADQIITWGGPIRTFRWDTFTDVDFKDLSVREIQVPN